MLTSSLGKGILETLGQGQQRSFIGDRAITCLTVTCAGVIAAGCTDGTVHLLRLPSVARVDHGWRR